MYIPKNTALVLNCYEIHHNEEKYPDSYVPVTLGYTYARADFFLSAVLSSTRIDIWATRCRAQNRANWATPWIGITGRSARGRYFTHDLIEYHPSQLFVQSSDLPGYSRCREGALALNLTIAVGF
jgi:hypothetical protein